LHVHDCLELGYCFSGSGVYLVGEKVMQFRAGDMVFVNQTEAHMKQCTPGGSPSKWSWVLCDPIRLVGHRSDTVAELDPTPFRGAAFKNILSGSTHPAHVRIMLRMIEELHANASGKASALRALVWELMTLMQREDRKEREPHGAARREYNRLAPALQIIARDYAQPLHTADLARRCGLSEVHFRRLFLQTIGCAPRTYWNNLRLHMAASLLRGCTRSVLEISMDVGFETLSSFNRLFLSLFGVSPRAWRNSGDDHQREAHCPEFNKDRSPT